MKLVSIFAITFLMFGCSINNYTPNESLIVNESSCESLSGDYTLDFDKYSYYNNSGFWKLRQYDQISIYISEKQVSLIGYNEHKVVSSFTAKTKDWLCSSGIISIDTDNAFLNKGGVLVYQARSVQLYSYEGNEVIIRFKEMSTGLAFLIPVMVGGDSIVQLKPMTNTSNNN